MLPPLAPTNATQALAWLLFHSLYEGRDHALLGQGNAFILL